MLVMAIPRGLENNLSQSTCGRLAMCLLGIRGNVSRCTIFWARHDDVLNTTAAGVVFVVVVACLELHEEAVRREEHPV
jgi:hypothetical protein